MMSFVLLITLVFGSAGKAWAEMPASSQLCNPITLYSKLIPAPYGNKVEQLFKEAIEDISHHESKNIPEISHQLLLEQAKLLKAKGVRFRMGPEEKWLDILPDPKGSALNQLAFKLRTGKETKHLLRYHPESLFTDSYQYVDNVLAYRQRAMYLSHRDVLGGIPDSEYLKKQLAYSEGMRHADRFFAGREGEDGLIYKRFNHEYRASISEKDYLKDYSKDDFVNPPHEPYARYRDRMDEILTDYLKKSPDLIVLKNEADPMVIRVSPSKRMGREDYGTPLVDIHGVSKEIYNIDKFRVSELSGPVTYQPDKSVYDIFLQDSYRDHLIDQSGIYRRALVLPSGKTLLHISGASDTKNYFNAYLDFLKTIYTDPKGLNLDPKLFEQLRTKSMEFSNRSELIVRANDKGWISAPKGKDVSGGLILVKSSNPSERLPILEANPNLVLKQPEDEIWVEAGRLGSLTADETIQFLKVAGASLHYQNRDKVVRIICEANKSRAKLFSRFGFKEVPVEIGDSPQYYPDGSNLVLQVTLEDFLKHVLK